MTRFSKKSQRQKLVEHVQELERLEEVKQAAVERLQDGFRLAKLDGFDTATLKVVLKLRKMTPAQRRERRALEAIYLAALGMLEGDPLNDEARRRLDGQPPEDDDKDSGHGHSAKGQTKPETTRDRQPSLTLKDPDEARKEGAAAAAAGKRIYDNPYPAGDPCRAAWDEGWCARSKSHGMDTPSAYQRRTPKPAEGTEDQDTEDAEKKEGAA